MIKDLSQDRLKYLLHYCQDSGIFTRLRLAGGQVPGSIAGRIEPKGYISISVDSKRYKAHRLAWLYVYGYLPEYEIDHINRIKDDNRIINLREATHKENMENVGIYKSNTTGMTGIDKRFGKWRARISNYGKPIHLGLFVTLEEALEARDIAQKRLHKNAAVI